MSRREVGLAFQSDKAPGEYARLAAAAEGYGIDVLSMYGDLMFQPPLGPLLEMARATSRVRLGPACLNPYSLHPYEIAGQVATLDLVSGGRAFLGLARGAWLSGVGIAQPHPVTHLAEAAGYVSKLLAGDDSGFSGDIFRLEPGVRLRYQPERTAVPLLIGGWGPQTLALAGRIAAEAKVGGSANPELVPNLVARIGADDVAAVIGAVTVVDEDAVAARALARTEVAGYLAVVADLDPTVELPPGLLAEVRTKVAAGDPEGAGRHIPDAVLDRFAISGTPQQVAARVEALFDAGADRVDLGTPHGLAAERGVELIGASVLPLLGSST